MFSTLLFNYRENVSTAFTVVKITKGRLSQCWKIQQPPETRTVQGQCQNALGSNSIQS